MPEIVGTIPDLIGSACEALVVQEYWYRGELHDEAIVLFLKPADRPWQRVFFDSGILFWKEVDSPDAYETTTADEYHYPQIDLTARHDLAGKEIQRVLHHDEQDSTRLEIEFRGGVRVVLQNHRDDRNSLQVMYGHQRSA
jgi:hypothetical protein